MSASWRIERDPEPFDRRVLVSTVGATGLALYLWFTAERPQGEAVALIAAMCTGLASLGLIGDRLGLFAFMRSTLSEIRITSDRVSFDAGHIHQVVRLRQLVRIDLRRTERGLALVLIGSEGAGCGLPEIAWEDLDVRSRLRALDGVRWDLFDAALSSEVEGGWVLWVGAEGEGLPFGG